MPLSIAIFCEQEVFIELCWGLAWALKRPWRLFMRINFASRWELSLSLTRDSIALQNSLIFILFPPLGNLPIRNMVVHFQSNYGFTLHFQENISRRYSARNSRKGSKCYAERMGMTSTFRSEKKYAFSFLLKFQQPLSSFNWESTGEEKERKKEDTTQPSSKTNRMPCLARGRFSRLRGREAAARGSPEFMLITKMLCKAARAMPKIPLFRLTSPAKHSYVWVQMLQTIRVRGQKYDISGGWYILYAN